MKYVNPIRLMALVATFALPAQAGQVAPSHIECDSIAKQCTAMVELDPGLVTWYITSQGDRNPGLTVSTVNSDGEFVEVIKTSVFSENLSNKSTGTFEVTEPGDYLLTFSDISDLREDIAGIFYRSTPVSITHQFAGDSDAGRTFRDVYASLTWMQRK